MKIIRDMNLRSARGHRAKEEGDERGTRTRGYGGWRSSPGPDKVGESRSDLINLEIRAADLSSPSKISSPSHPSPQSVLCMPAPFTFGLTTLSRFSNYLSVEFRGPQFFEPHGHFDTLSIFLSLFDDSIFLRN